LPDDVRVFKCVICGRTFLKRESLAAHLGHHKEVEFKRLSVRLPKERLEWFENYCRKHNTTSCHLILAFFSFLEEGEKHGNIILGSPNPTFFVLQEIFMARPRGHGKYDFGLGPGSEPGGLNVSCFYIGAVSGGDVYCNWLGGSWVSGQRCQTCPKNRLRRE
jgi:hypothetical protein